MDSTEPGPGNAVDTGAASAERRSLRRKGTPYYRLQNRRATFDGVIALRVEGVSISAISRIEGIAWNTIARWLEKAAQVCRRFNHRRIAGFAAEELQAVPIPRVRCVPEPGSPVSPSRCANTIQRRWLTKELPGTLGGRDKSGHFRRPETGVEFYFTVSCVRKVVWTLMRQLRGQHLSTCEWWRWRRLLFIEEFPYVFITVIRDAKRAISHIEGSCGLWSSTEQSEQMW